MRTLFADAAVDGGDQAVWHSYFKRTRTGADRYNFRPGGGIYDRDCCSAHRAYVDVEPARRAAQGAWSADALHAHQLRPYLNFPDAVRLKVDRNATAWNERFRRAVVAPPALANVDEARRAAWPPETTAGGSSTAAVATRL